MVKLTEIDPEIAALLERERIRQNTTIQLIPINCATEQIDYTAMRDLAQLRYLC